jgi:signal transduction histidine kinase
VKHLNLLLISFVFYLSSCTIDQPKQLKKETNIFYDKAYEARERRALDSAFLYYNKAKEVFVEKNDSFGIAKCLVNMAIISTDKGDYFGSYEFSLNAIPYLDKKNKDHQIYIISNLTNLGVTSSSLEKYSQAISFYKQTLDFVRDTFSLITVENNIAYAYSQQGDYKTAIAQYNGILSRGIKDKSQYAKILSNNAAAKWLQNPNYKAVPDLLKALAIRVGENDLSGLHSSYSYLSDYYAQEHIDSALFYAVKMNKVAEQYNNADDKLMALRKLVKLSKPEDTKHYFSSYQNLSDSIQTARNGAKNQFALIRYQTEKQKADNLILQQENTKKKYQLGLLFFIAALSIMAIVFWYKKRKQKLELEAQNTIKESQLKTSKKVHDVVANGLYRVMTEIENQTTIDREGILDRLENMYEKSRDISYEEHHSLDQHFHEKVTNLLKSFVTENTKILFLGNTADLWKNTNIQVKYEVEHILQELLVNMKRHSQANNVFIKFEQKHKNINISYTDDGIGIQQDIKFKNGLTNTGNRINSISGTINFETEIEKGLKIQISFPFS